MKNLYIFVLACLLISYTTIAQVVPTSGVWTEIGDVNLSIVTDDADNGDGVGDGAIYVDGLSAVVGQGITHTFDGTMTLGESITINTYTYNRNVSYVNFTVGLYNVTDNTTLTISSNISISNESSPPVLTTLNYAALASDVGDVLELKYIRTDDGNGARNFVIDNLELNGTFVSISLASSCPFTVTPDLPLLTSNATIEAEINTAIGRFSNAYLGTSFSGTLTAADASYAALGISVNSGEISSTTPITNFNQVDFLKTYAQYLKFNPSDAAVKEKANNTVWLTGKYFCSGTLPLNSQMYDYEKFARPASLLQDFLDPDVKDLFAFTLYEHSVQFEHFWEPTYDATYQETNGAINTDLIYNISDAMLAYSLWHDTADERYQYMRGYKRYINRFFSNTYGTTDGIKADGTGFHHWTAYNNYMYSFNTAASLLFYLEGTSFQVDESNYKVFSGSFFAQYMQANDDGVQALSSAGRNPQNRTRPISQSALKTLAIAGGDILGLSTADPVLAGLYNRIYGVDVDFNYSTVASFENGFFQFNHASVGLFRKNNWVAFNKGFTSNMWGAEIYEGQNRYGRYQSYGALEVIYTGDKVIGNGYDVDTWDWNYNPGTTVIRLPWANLHAEKARIDEMQQKRFVGALSLKNKGSEVLTSGHGDYGMFAMDFQELEGQGFSTVYSSENHNNTFTFKKSNFYFDDIIVCLASGINNNDASNQTITTLYQRLDNMGTPNVNGASQSASGEVTFSGASDNWLLSNYNTGFYLLSGNHSLKVKKEVQQTPNQNQIWPVTITGNATDTYYTGYLDHGTSPVNESYEYILIPDSDATEMQALDVAIQASDKPYTVHQQDANAHIVEHEAKNVWGYAFFNNATSLTYDYVTDVDDSCLVMTEYNNANQTLLVSVTNPDIGFEIRSYAASVTTTRQITLQGEWVLSTSYSGVQMLSANSTETVIEFTLVDGLAKEVLLNNAYIKSDVNGDWNVGTTWIGGIVPTASDDVQIDHTVTIKGDETVANVLVNNNTSETGYLIINSGWSLKATGDLTITGSNTNGVLLASATNKGSSLIVEGTASGIGKYSRRTAIASSNGGTNDLISASLAGDTFQSIVASSSLYENGTTGVYLFGPFNNADNPGVYETYDTAVDGNTIIESGKGYRAGTIGGNDVVFTGTIRTDQVDISITEETGAYGSWNLIGNPYPSYLSFKNFFDLVSDATGAVAGPNNKLDPAYTAVYGYDADDTDPTGSIWTIWDFNNLTYASDLIITGQGFFVKAKAGAGAILDDTQVTFTPSMRTIGTSDDFISGRMADTNLALAKLNLTNADISYTTNIYFRDINTRGLDPGYDTGAYNQAAFGIYTHLVEDNNGVQLANQSLPYTNLNDVVVPLLVNADQGVQISIGLDTASIVPSTTYIYLEDNVTNTWTLLNSGEYTFTPSVALSGTGRFFVHFSATTLSLDDNNWNGLQIYSTESSMELFIKGQLTDGTTAYIYDIQGRLILTRELNQYSTKNTIDISSISTGIYVVKVDNGNQAKTQKVSIK